jgi:alpha-glucosidase
MTTGTEWWRAAVIYQIYPRSFADANADGVGDLRGISGRLDYVAGLGVDAVWLSPIFRSPMADFGYDVADYRDIDPIFGTLAALDTLVSEAHARGLRVILDLVPNHSSDEHPWFVDARSSRTSMHRDWYVWRDPAPDGGPPNNWQSYFGGPAWEWDEPSGQYYLRVFHRKQPDLNWRNPEVRTAMYEVMRFWFDRGIDGFRIDVLWLLIKDAEFRDAQPHAPADPDEQWDTRDDWPHYEDQPEVHEIVREMRRVSDEYDERVLIGEIYLPLDRLVRFYGEDLAGIHLPFNFGLVTIPDWNAVTVARTIDRYEAALPAGAWPNWVLGNHDVPRIATRVGQARARLAQMLLLTLRGTVTAYYGDEIGMHDAEIPADRTQDPLANVGKNRDGARSPMQWDSSGSAGFSPSSAEPWLPLAADHHERNVALQDGDPESELSLFRRLVRLRRASAAVSLGSYLPITTADDDVLAYLRQLDDERVLVVLNFGAAPTAVDVSMTGSAAELLCSTTMTRSRAIARGPLALDAHEGVVVRLR